MKHFILLLAIFGASQTFLTLRKNSVEYTAPLVPLEDTFASVPSGFMNVSSKIPFKFCDESAKRKAKINFIDLQNLAPGKTLKVTVNVTA